MGCSAQLQKREPGDRTEWRILTTKACYNRSVASCDLLDRSLKDGAGERIRTLDPRITSNVSARIFLASLTPTRFRSQLVTSQP